MKKLFSLLFAAILIAIAPASSFAIVSSQDTTKQDDTVCRLDTAVNTSAKYVITNYHAKIKVNENNVYNVTEDYEVCYTTAGSHGIYRDIPTKTDLRRANGDVTKNVKTQVSNIKVSGDDFTQTREGDSVRLKIGNANRTLSRGQTKKYAVSYDYNFGPDNLKGVDEFYFNLIGTEWASDVLFLNTDFEIYFPKDIDESKIGFTHGYAYDSLSGGVTFNLQDNRTIVGNYNGSLKGGEALTIRVTLPDGYIQNAAYDTNTIGLIIFTAITVIILGIIVSCFLVFGRDEKLTLYNRTTPPDGMNPVQFGALINSSDSECVTSLFYYLAEKGYLKIEETSKKKYDIIILKDYDGSDNSEKIFMQSLKRYDSDNDGRIELSSLKDSFYTKINSITRAAGIKGLKNKIYTKSGNTYQALAYVTLVLYIFIMTIALIADQNADQATVFFALFLTPFIVPGAMVTISGFTQLFKRGSNKASSIIPILFGGLFVCIPLKAFPLFQLTFEPTQIAMISEGVAAIIIITLCAKNGKRYTEEGRKIMTDVLSYYENIKNAKPDADHGFSYFYYTFAFAFAAGLSSAFAKRFKDAIANPPDWYSSTTDFSHFNTSSFSSAMRSISSSSTSSPSSSSSSGGSSGSSGGGSSGGGGGGGGGGGW